MTLSSQSRRRLELAFASTDSADELEGLLGGYLGAKVFYVHSGDGSNAYDGLSWRAPFATLDYAIGQCTADDGDVIFVRPGHAENLAAASAVNVDVAGVRIIGLGEGNLRPTFSATAAAGEFEIGAANVTIRNLRLVCNFTGGSTAAIQVAAAADGCTLDGLEFQDTTNAKEWLVHISVATTVTDLVVRGCKMIGLVGGSMTNSILFAGTSSNVVLEDNYFFVDSSDSVIDHAADAAVNFRASRNIVINEDTTTALYCLQQHASSTGVAHDNRFAYNKVDAEVSAGAAMWWFNNLASNTIAESGLLDPTTSHAIP